MEQQDDGSCKAIVQKCWPLERHLDEKRLEFIRFRGPDYVAITDRDAGPKFIETSAREILNPQETKSEYMNACVENGFSWASAPVKVGQYVSVLAEYPVDGKRAPVGKRVYILANPPVIQVALADEAVSAVVERLPGNGVDSPYGILRFFADPQQIGRIMNPILYQEISTCQEQLVAGSSLVSVCFSSRRNFIRACSIDAGLSCNFNRRSYTAILSTSINGALEWKGEESKSQMLNCFGYARFSSEDLIDAPRICVGDTVE